MTQSKPMEQAQRFSGAHAAAYHLFTLWQNLVSAGNYRFFILNDFASLEETLGINLKLPK